jgi:subtilisin family serine protease
MGAEENACIDSSACPDQTTLLQSKVQMHMSDEDDPSLMEHEHRTSIEVNLATTKVLGGVPIYNYHLANAGGMNPSLAELFVQKVWIIIFDDSATDDDEAAFCEYLKTKFNDANVKCIASGDPDHSGEPYVAVKANEEELKAVLSQHSHKVKYGEPDGPIGIDDPEPDPSLIEDDATSIPWGLDRIDDATGQDGSYKTPTNSKEGAGAHVYVADTGVRTTHQDFEGRAIPAYDYYKSGNDKVCDQKDTSCGNDRNGHGTHCAGTIVY